MTSTASACLVCARSDAGAIAVGALRPQLTAFLAKRLGDKWDARGHLCRAHLNEARIEFVTQALERERGELGEVEAHIARKAERHATIAQHADDVFERSITRGQRIADGVARIGGSWTFVLSFLLALALWIAFNSLILRGEAFDPYPYILLNLALSCLAALQAPVIMMAQNRLSARDRAQADQDFKVNLKAELEVAGLHDKVDHLLHAQWERMVELQELQIEILTELAAASKDEKTTES